ncbi:unnamed protein product, partial [Meganyctiphanes norvegica]
MENEIKNIILYPKHETCYIFFLYYALCNSGTACPFRHEPAALRNETVCMYWMSGTCAKESCIFRHMEITKKRDKIQCWWETQPGGCKKPHCSFQHQNILDHPREEDIKRTPDLILPVKTNGGTERNGSKRQVMPPQRVHTPPITPTVVTPTPIIVPLFDGESDTESTGGTPQKQHAVQQLSAQTEWELRKLRQIQAHEANLIGYCFEDDIEQQYEEGEIEEELEEEVEEEEEKDIHVTVHLPLFTNGFDIFSIELHSRLSFPLQAFGAYSSQNRDMKQRTFESNSHLVNSNAKNHLSRTQRQLCSFISLVCGQTWNPRRVKGLRRWRSRASLNETLTARTLCSVSLRIRAPLENDAGGVSRHSRSQGRGDSEESDGTRVSVLKRVVYRLIKCNGPDQTLSLYLEFLFLIRKERKSRRAEERSNLSLNIHLHDSPYIYARI